MTSGDGDDGLDGEFARLLAAYDESLATGQSISLDDAGLSRSDPARFSELEAACALLATTGSANGPARAAG